MHTRPPVPSLPASRAGCPSRSCGRVWHRVLWQNWGLRVLGLRTGVAGSEGRLTEDHFAACPWDVAAPRTH